MIKFLDLHKINHRFETDFKKQFTSFLNSGHYVLGEGVSNFESQFATYCNTKHCVGVSSGLDALILIFKAYIQLGKLQVGDQVLVPANTYIASIISILEVGLTPVFVEPELATFNCSANQYKQHITKKTKAILMVHLYGQLANAKAILELTENNNLLLIEDAAQAHGAKDSKGGLAGSLSHAAAFSFYPSKNLGALGEAGAITTNDNTLAVVVKQLRNYGTISKYNNERLGVNNRLDDVQARFLSVKLQALDQDNQNRKAIAKRYLANIKNSKITLPYYDGSDNHVFHLFVVLVENRKEFMDYLEANLVQSAIHYPVPPHKQKALGRFNDLKLPITEKIHDTCVSLPISPVMSEDQVKKVITLINNY
ncbi:DegT/DnrJ/EryC1/StrS aminotransferase family protein [Olleya sp. ITB9]|uniref:DegT/DnrJ/EryC1/StrS family aminotransferase n=1 Tax=Olleya sp. ITB9 TaxID=1715648 RepID=UPI0006D0F02F|nr:DegT/DnrJ/EryC1/StrS family aminotransferase [Olleya sp. ITB9]